MKQAEVISVFVSSPSDMVVERERVEKICDDLNDDFGFREGTIFRALLWERQASSGKAERSQEVISEQLSGYDIYVGIMGNTFGTPTGQYGSGTEEEFHEAVKLHANGSVCEVQFYFSEKTVNLSDVDLDEAKKVKDFRAMVGASGVLYRTYDDLNQFDVFVRRGLYAARDKVLKSRGEADEEEPTLMLLKQKPHEILPNLRKQFASDPQVSSHVLTVEAVKKLEEFNEQTNAQTKRMKKLAKLLNDTTSEFIALNTGKRKNSKRAERLFSQTLSEIEDFNYEFAQAIVSLDESFKVSMNSFVRAVQIVYSTDEMEKGGVTFAVEGLGQLKVSLSDLKGILAIVGDTWANAFTTGDRLIGSARTFKALCDDFSDFLDRAIVTIDAVQESIPSSE